MKRRPPARGACAAVKKTRPEDDEARFVIGDVTFDLYQDAVSEMREGIEMWVDGEGQFHTIHVWGAMELLSDSLSSELTLAPARTFGELRRDVQHVSGNVVDALLEVDQWGDQSEYVERALPESFVDSIREPSTVEELRQELVALPWMVPLQWRLDASMLGVDIVALASARRNTIESRLKRGFDFKRLLR
jgi:hypothetical protein